MARIHKKMSEGIKDFATGVYRSIDKKAASKIINNNKSKGIAPDVAKNLYKQSTKSAGFKAGVAVANSAPLRGITGSAKAMIGAKNAGKDISLAKAIKQGHMKADGKSYDMGKIAGTTFSIGVAGRIASGGGLYKDKYGNTNLPGVPFI